MSGRPVIASVDGSEKAARAIAVAAAIARFADADLSVIRVMGVPADRLPGQAEAVGLNPAAATGRREIKTRLADAVVGVAVASGRRVGFDVLEARDVADAIIERAAQRDALALVMATRAPGRVGRAVAGSVADRVMRESLRPVMLVPPGAAFLAGRPCESRAYWCRKMVRRLPSDVSSFSSNCRTLEISNTSSSESCPRPTLAMPRK